MTSRRPFQSGNVLFLILIAVALFAALSYVVTSSSRTGAGSASPEKAQLVAADLVQYANSIEVGVEKMRIKGVPDWQLDFYAPRTPANANANCTTDKCIVFAPAGGGVIWRDMNGGSALGQAYYAAGVKDIGTTLPDIVLFIGNVTKEACQHINFKMGVFPTLKTTPPGDSHSGTVHLSGSRTSFPAASKIFGNTTNPAFAGKRDFCYAHGSWDHVYIHVLLPR